MATFESVSAPSNSGASNTATATTVMSASAQVGSYALLAVTQNSGSAFPALPTGGSGQTWRQLSQVQQSNTMVLAVFGRPVAPGDPGATFSVAFGGAVHWD